ncbi:Uncharacterised protein [uncultured archaeon]|nr:Uncharacterised protein [uncultured archaeon]
MISSLILPGSSFLDIEAGTGAYCIPFSRKTNRTIAVCPSRYQLKILQQKAIKADLEKISLIEKEQNEVDPVEVAGHLCRGGRLSEKSDGHWVSFSVRDALLYITSENPG